jgi:hypothetical protein
LHTIIVATATAINATNITGLPATTATHILLVALLLSLELNRFSAAAAGAGTIGAFETGIDFKSARSVRLRSKQRLKHKIWPAPPPPPPQE